MTELLTRLLNDEASVLAVPAAPAADVLARGRSLRRRRTAVPAAAAVLAVIAGTGAAALLMNRDDSPGATGTPDATPPAATAGAFGVDRTVHLGSGDAAAFPLSEDIHSLHYTSAGVVVRTNLNGGVSDGSGPEHFWLVTDEGVEQLPVTLDGVVPATSAELPYLVWTESRADGRFEVVLLDVTTEEEQRIALPEGTGKSYWATPPVAIDGAFVYAGLAKTTLAVDWTTGEISTAPGQGGGMPIVAGGVATAGNGSLVDATTGATLVEGQGWSLSPDGRFAFRNNWGEGPAELVDVSTGTSVSLDAEADLSSFGWSADGALFRPHPGGIEVCSAYTGECHEEETSADVPTEAEVNVGYSEICELRPGVEEPAAGTMPHPDDMVCHADPDQPKARILKLGGQLYES